MRKRGNVREALEALEALKALSDPPFSASSASSASLLPPRRPGPLSDHLVEGRAIQPPAANRYPSNTGGIGNVTQRIPDHEHEVGSFASLNGAPC